VGKARWAEILGVAKATGAPPHAILGSWRSIRLLTEGLYTDGGLWSAIAVMQRRAKIRGLCRLQGYEAFEEEDDLGHYQLSIPTFKDPPPPAVPTFGALARRGA